MTWLIWIAFAALLLAGLVTGLYMLLRWRVRLAVRQGWLIAMRAMEERERDG